MTEPDRGPDSTKEPPLPFTLVPEIIIKRIVKIVEKRGPAPLCGSWHAYFRYLAYEGVWQDHPPYSREVVAAASCYICKSPEFKDELTLTFKSMLNKNRPEKPKAK